jgi:uncharacterized protein DUF3592
MILTGRSGLSFNDRYSPRDRRAIGIAVMVLGVFTFVSTANLFRLNRQFVGPTIKASGFVEALYPSRRLGSNPNVAYRYPVGAVEVHTVAPVGREVFNGLQIGDPLPVKYLPDNPTINRIDLPAINSERQEAPYGMTALSILFMCVGAFVFRKAYRDLRFGKTHRSRRALGHVPDLNNSKEVRARGWMSEDFSKILIDFRKLYDDCLENEIEVKIQSLKDGTLRVTFPQDVPDRLFPSLINYAQYPKGFEPKVGSILVVGKAVISENFEGNPEPKLIGQEGVFYVPSDDRKHDVVYVQIGEETFSNSFASNRWKKVADPRLPAGFASLSSISRLQAR